MKRIVKIAHSERVEELEEQINKFTDQLIEKGLVIKSTETIRADGYYTSILIFEDDTNLDYFKVSDEGLSKLQFERVYTKMLYTVNQDFYDIVRMRNYYENGHRIVEWWCKVNDAKLVNHKLNNIAIENTKL